MAGALKNSVAFAILIYSHLVFMFLMGCLIAGFAYYGFKGEGDWDCYATQDDNKTVPWDKADGEVPDSYHHVNANFKVVCIWGFFNYFASYLLALMFMCASSNVLDSGWFIFYSMMTMSCHLAHFITMMTLRWRHAGKTCSGDYLTDPNRYSLFDA